MLKVLQVVLYNIQVFQTVFNSGLSDRAHMNTVSRVNLALTQATVDISGMTDYIALVTTWLCNGFTASVNL